MPLVGGVGELKEPDEAVKSVLNDIRKEVEEKAGRAFSEFTPVHYKTQLVNGVNYFIKVKIEGEEHLHIRAHKSFQGETTLHSFQDKKTAQEEVTF